MSTGRPGLGAQAPRPGGPSRSLGQRPGTSGREPGTGYRTGAPGGLGGLGGYRPGAGGPPSRGGRAGGPSGGSGGRGGQSRARRPRSRKQGREELEAQGPTTYVPSHAPVPEGEVIVERGSTAQELAPRLNRGASDVVRFLFAQGEMVTATMSLSDEMIELFAAEIGAQVRLVDPGDRTEAELQARYFGEDDEDERDELMRSRPPVVTVMGHVDHGKTTLLDRIRESDVASGETGGITQHIGAYQVTTANGAVTTFIDTPGHEAFTAMRARGAEVTDIVVLVVAADDGVMPQTIEAINHAKAAGVPIVIALNKIDRADADPNRVMQQLADHGLVPERWGGDTVTVETSALQNLGVDDLLEQLMVVAEVEELKANPEARPRGVVLEANLDPGKGPVATVIVQAGTLRVGDHIVAGAAWGRVKALIDDKGDNVKEAPPSFPAQVLGFDAMPAAGDEFRVVATGRTAREIAEQREQRYRTADLRRSAAATSGGAKLEDIFEQIQRGETATLNVVVKADVQGSLEAVTESLRKLERDDVKLAFVHRAVGGITENDVALAAASNATIIGFNVRPGREARAQAVAQGVEIRTYEIIYKLIEDVQAAMVGMLAPEYEEVLTGEAEVRQVFRVPRVGAVAGCFVRTGVITRGSKVRFLRDGIIIWKGAITSLRRFKEDVREVHEGFECGIGLSNNQDLREGDIIETYEEREIQRT
jgi:translation initiation factor IF-2